MPDIRYDYALLLNQLRRDVKNNMPISLGDDELHELARLAAVELVARLPEYAMRQGDLPESYEDAIFERQLMLARIEDAEIHPTVAADQDA